MTIIFTPKQHKPYNFHKTRLNVRNLPPDGVAALLKRCVHKQDVADFFACIEADVPPWVYLALPSKDEIQDVPKNFTLTDVVRGLPFGGVPGLHRAECLLFLDKTQGWTALWATSSGQALLQLRAGLTFEPPSNTISFYHYEEEQRAHHEKVQAAIRAQAGFAKRTLQDHRDGLL